MRITEHIKDAKVNLYKALMFIKYGKDLDNIDNNIKIELLNECEDLFNKLNNLQDKVFNYEKRK